MRKHLLTLLILVSGWQVHAQTEGAVIINNSKESAGRPGGIAYNRELSAGGRLTTAGWGAFADYTRRVSMDKKRTMYFEVMFLKHPKELKKVNEYNFAFSFDSPKPFVYAKQNSFFSTRFGYGNKFLIGEKAEKSGFEISFNYILGPSLGLVKPYYLEILYEQDGNIFSVPQQYAPETASLFLDASSIYGYSGFSKGLSEVSVLPGAFAKAGLSFDWAAFDEYIKSIETGIGAELYLQDVPIMILENNKPYFVFLYLSLQVGKKW
jgi:hypothetical protein